MRWLVWLTIRESVPLKGTPGRTILPREVEIGHIEAKDARQAWMVATRRFVSLRGHPLRVQSLASWREGKGL